MKFCTKCGSQNVEDANFCISCGNPFPKEMPLKDGDDNIKSDDTKKDNAIKNNKNSDDKEKVISKVSKKDKSRKIVEAVNNTERNVSGKKTAANIFSSPSFSSGIKVVEKVNLDDKPKAGSIKKEIVKVKNPISSKKEGRMRDNRVINKEMPHQDKKEVDSVKNKIDFHKHKEIETEVNIISLISIELKDNALDTDSLSEYSDDNYNEYESSYNEDMDNDYVEEEIFEEEEVFEEADATEYVEEVLEEDAFYEEEFGDVYEDIEDKDVIDSFEEAIVVQGEENKHTHNRDDEMMVDDKKYENRTFQDELNTGYRSEEEYESLDDATTQKIKKELGEELPSHELEGRRRLSRIEKKRQIITEQDVARRKIEDIHQDKREEEQYDDTVINDSYYNSVLPIDHDVVQQEKTFKDKVKDFAPYIGLLVVIVSVFWIYSLIVQ